MNRRAALRRLAAAVTALPALAKGATRDHSGFVARGRASPLDRIGLQLYTVRSLMARDFEGTLVRVSHIGYREVEFAGYFGRTPAQVRNALAAAGLEAPAAHIPFDDIRADPARAFGTAAEAGHRYAVVAWLGEEWRSADGYRRAADAFNRAGEQARAAGLRFAYHNHAFEFERLDGAETGGPNRPVDGGNDPIGHGAGRGGRRQAPTGYDILLRHTAPELVAFEMDLFWIAKGGADPVAYFRKNPGRFELVHLKDMGPPPERKLSNVGAGTIDFARIFAQAEHAGIRHYFVEHDHPADPLNSIRASYNYLKEL